MLGTVAALPVLGLGWWQSHNLAEKSASEWDELLIERTQDAAEDVETILRIRLDEIELLAARAESIADWSDTAKLRGLFDGRFGAAGFSVLFLGDAWGTSLVASPAMSPNGQGYAGINYRDRSYYLRMLETGRPEIGDAAIGRRTRSANISLVAPVKTSTGALRGYVQGAIKLEQLRDRVVANVRHGDSRIVVVDAVGSVVVDSADELPALSRFNETPQAGPGGPATLITIEPADEVASVRRASAPVSAGDAPWRVYVSSPTSQIVARAADLRQATLWATGGALLAALLLVYLLATVSSADMRRLAAVVVRVGQGDYSPVERASRFIPHEAVEVRRALHNMTQLLEAQRHERTALIADLQRANEQIVRDVAGKRLAEQAMYQSERLASLGMLAAGVAHEINNPMTYVVGNLEYLTELQQEGVLTTSDPDLDLPTYLADSLHGARRVIEIVADLRSLSQQPRAEGTTAVASGPLTMETCLRMAQSQLRHRAEVVRHFPEEEVCFRINPQRLSQVLLNLILNAAQAMPEGTASRCKLTVAIRRRDDGRGELEVTDTGSGMPPEIAQRIFDPFFTTKSTGLGTGLGLTICHSIVTAAQGEIRVDSELGKGSRFTVVLPLAEPTDEPGGGDTRALEGLSILVVDDEPGVLTAIRRMLISCRTATATSARQALEMIEHERYDLVLSDIMMAEVTGLQLVQTLRDRHPDLARRVCLMTGGVIGGDLAEAVKRVGVPLLHKPMTRNELHQALSAVHNARPRRTTGTAANVL